MKSLIKSLFLIIMLFSLSGCILKKDDFDGAIIYTTTYTIEYITKSLYGEHANITSIYPDGVNIPDYDITNKKLNDFSKGRLFIYNGLSNDGLKSEKQLAADLVNKNNNLNIIDVSQGLEIKYEAAELWISPANCLMIAQNIKNGLKDRVTNTSILDEIDKNYEDLKILISTYDADFKLIAENASNLTLIASNKAFNFLSKYGFEIINVADDEEANSSTSISQAKKAFSSKENQYLFTLTGTEENDKIKELVNTGAKIKYINPMVNLTDEERENNDNYITFMNAFIEAIKSEVY